MVAVVLVLVLALRNKVRVPVRRYDRNDRCDLNSFTSQEPSQTGLSYRLRWKTKSKLAHELFVVPLHDEYVSIEHPPFRCFVECNVVAITPRRAGDARI